MRCAPLLAATLRIAMAADSGGGPDAPAGWYLAADVAELVGVHPRSIVQWASHGYIEPHRDLGPPQVFSYQDVGEALFVRELLDRRVPRDEIRMTVKNARSEFGAWPLQAAPIGIYEGKMRSRIGLRRSDGTYDIGGTGGRQKFFEIDELVGLANLLRRGGWVIRTHPEIERVEVDPEKLSGKPCIVGRRIPVSDVVEIAKEKGGRRTLRTDYGLAAKDISDALAWQSGVTELLTAA